MANLDSHGLQRRAQALPSGHRMHWKPLQTLSLLSAFGIALLTVSTASAETRRDEIYSSILSFNESMMPLLDHYLYIQAELANDSIWRVSRAGGMIALEAKNIDPTQIKSELAQIFKYLPKRLRETGRKIYKAKDLKEMRELFALLSRPLVMWAQETVPAGISIYYDSTYNASWLQKNGPPVNPYWGQSMLRNGKLVGKGENTGDAYESPLEAISDE